MKQTQVALLVVALMAAPGFSAQASADDPVDQLNPVDEAGLTEVQAPASAPESEPADAAFGPFNPTHQVQLELDDAAPDSMRAVGLEINSSFGSGAARGF
jgi:hypothetical protein